VQPRASRDEIVGWQDATLRLRVTAPPVAGAANAAVTRLLAHALHIPASSISVVRGLKGRDKVVEITGFSDGDVRARLESRSGTPTEVRAYRSRVAPVSGHPRSKPASRPPLP
jgi:uncharacterized protein